MLDYAYTNHQDAFKISIISNSQLCCSHMNYLLSELWTRSKNTANKISLVFLLGKKWKAVNHCVKSMKGLTGLFSHGGVYEQKKGWGPKGKGLNRTVELSPSHAGRQPQHPDTAQSERKQKACSLSVLLTLTECSKRRERSFQRWGEGRRDGAYCTCKNRGLCANPLDEKVLTNMFRLC